jgi:hypothetical protein
MDREIDRVLNIMEGEAWHRRRGTYPDAQLLKRIEGNCVVVAVLRFMTRRDRYEAMAEELYDTLEAVCGQIVSYHKSKWPGAAHVFTRRLRESAALFKEAGLLVERKHSRAGCRVTITKLPNWLDDSGSVTASPEPSRSNPVPDSMLRTCDATTDEETRADTLAILDQMRNVQPTTSQEAGNA